MKLDVDFTAGRIGDKVNLRAGNESLVGRTERRFHFIVDSVKD